MRHLLVFVAVALADALWTRYIVTASGHRPFAAANYSAGIILVGAFATLSYVDDPRYLVSACLGAWVGTWLTVRRG
jgi:hypothetical protein